jgi:hypothetical protein
MIWTAWLLSISAYGWYQVFTFNEKVLYDPATGFAGMLMLALLPTFLGFISNRYLLKSQPTVLKLVLSNSMQYLLYSGGLIWGNLLWCGIFTLPTAVPVDWKIYIFFPALWQLLSWLIGAYYCLNFNQCANPSLHLKTVEISLLLFTTVLFLLSFIGLPGVLLGGLIGCWFILFTVTLALWGANFTAAAVPRLDIIFIHAVVPFLAAVIFFFIFFSREALQLLLSIQRGIISAWLLFVRLLDSFLGKPPETNYTPEYGSAPFLPQGGGELQELSTWWLVPLILIGFILLVVCFRELIKLLYMHLSAHSMPASNRTVLPGLRAVGYRFVQLLKLFSQQVITWLKITAGKLRDEIKRRVRYLLSSPDPYLQIVRSYEAFLRLGQKAGCGKKAWETPLEYARRFIQSAPKHAAAEREVIQLTNLFLEAHYRNKPVSREQSDRGRMYLQRLRSLL